MTWNLAQTMSLIKARIKKYKYRRPKPGGGYKYYYEEHHGGGITSAAFEAGSAFKLTFKGRRGHFHIKSVDGDMITISHDARPGVEIPPIHRDELRALLEKQHSKAETKSREKAQKRRKSAAKKRKSTKRKSTKRQAPAKRPQLSVADQVEEHRGQLLDQAKALKERIEGLDKKKDKAEIARLRDEAGALSGAALLAQRAQRDGVENAGPMIQKQIEQTQRMIDRSDNAEHTARLTRDLEQKRKLLDIIEGKTQVEPERPKREKAQSETAQQGADNFETMPEEPRNLKTARRELKEKEEILEGSKRAGTSADKLAEIESEIADKRSKVEVLEEDHFSNVFADKLRSSAESAKGKRLIDALAEAHEKREGVKGAERALIDFYKETALKRKGSPERLKDREFKDLRNIKDRWLESDEDTLYDSLKEQETEARQIYFEHVSSGDSSPYTQAQVDAAVKRQTERGARAEALKFAYTEGMLRTAQELKAQDETTQQAPQRSQTAQAFSGMVDTIKSGERSQKAQDAFKTELNKVIDKAESGTLTDAERAELLPIAEQLVEVTSGRARALMTAVRDQIKGSSEDVETAQVTDTRNPIARAVDQATPAHPTGYSSDAQGRLTISGFVAERYGYPTKKEAVADAKANGHSAGDVVSVSNRFWTGYAISRIDPVTKERVFFDKTSAEPEAIKVPLADKATHHRRGHLFDEGGDIRTTQRAQGQGFKV